MNIDSKSTLRGYLILPKTLRSVFVIMNDKAQAK
jgi:hypothetical protein